METFNNNTIIFTMARMNPPTPGHLNLIKKLIDEANHLNVNKIFLILSKTNDNNEDPIPCDLNPDNPNFSFKINIIDSMVQKLKEDMVLNIQNSNMLSNDKNNIIQKINNIQVISRCVPIVPKPIGIRQPTPFTPLYTIIYDDFKNITNLKLFMIIGDDRKNLLDNISDSFYKKIDNIQSIDGIVMPREGMSEYKSLSPIELEKLDMNTVPLNAFSASFIRNLVRYNLKNKFSDIYRPYLSELEINKLYDTIKAGLNMKSVKKSNDKQYQTLKYNYPMIKNENTINNISESNIKKRKYDISTNGGNKKGKKTNKKVKKTNKKVKKTNKKVKKTNKKRIKNKSNKNK
jgi:nicotinic acid mononucleotide adenylyltransferase